MNKAEGKVTRWFEANSWLAIFEQDGVIRYLFRPSILFDKLEENKAMIHGELFSQHNRGHTHDVFLEAGRVLEEKVKIFKGEV